MIRGKRFWKLEDPVNEGEAVFVASSSIIGVYRAGDGSPSIALAGDSEGFGVTEDDYQKLKVWAEGESTTIGYEGNQ